MEAFENRRRSKRYRKKLATICLTDSTGAIQVRTDSEDISEHGMRIVSTRDLVRGREITAVLHVPEKDTADPEHVKIAKIELSAEVVWTQPSTVKRDYFDIGIKFTLMPEDKKALLKKLIASLVTDEEKLSS